MKRNIYIFNLAFLLMACQLNSNVGDQKQKDTLITKSNVDSTKQDKIEHRLSFKSILEIVADTSYSTWVKLENGASSLTLNFQDKDTLAISYSPECWLIYPYKVDSNKIVVYWDDNIDTKYQFDIVKALHKTSKKLIGKPFMTLELKNDTTLKATYLMKDLIKKINTSSEAGRTFFPDQYTLVQYGTVYD